MRYIKTYEKFNVVNENWALQAFNWVKEKLSGWISKLTGEVKEGAESAMNWIKENPELMEETHQKLKQQDQSELMKLWNWVKSFVGNPLQIQSTVKESVEEETETMLEKIARISGASLALLICFGAPVAAFLGLAMGNGLLFITGSIVSIIAWSLASLFEEDMRYLIDYKLFESVVTGEKYLLTLSSANSMLGAKTWIAGTSPRITDRVKSDAERSWSLYAMLNKISPNSRLRRLSNKELAEEIGRRGVRPLRIEYDEVCKELLPQFHKLFNKFKSELKIDKKIEFMSQLEEEGYTFCDNSYIIKIINFEDLEDEMSIISDIFEYFCLYPA